MKSRASSNVEFLGRSRTTPLVGRTCWSTVFALGLQDHQKCVYTFSRIRESLDLITVVCISLRRIDCSELLANEVYPNVVFRANNVGTSGLQIPTASQRGCTSCTNSDISTVFRSMRSYPGANLL